MGKSTITGRVSFDIIEISKINLEEMKSWNMNEYEWIWLYSWIILEYIALPNTWSRICFEIATFNLNQDDYKALSLSWFLTSHANLMFHGETCLKKKKKKHNVLLHPMKNHAVDELWWLNLQFFMVFHGYIIYHLLIGSTLGSAHPT